MTKSYSIAEARTVSLRSSEMLKPALPLKSLGMESPLQF